MALKASTKADWTSSSIAIPTGAAAGDIVILDAWSENSAITAPSGFTLEVHITYNGGAYHFSRFWKRLTTSESGTYSTTEGTMYTCMLFSGRIGSGSPFDTTTVTMSGSGTSALSGLSITPATTGSDVVVGVGTNNSTWSDSWVPSGWTTATSANYQGSYCKQFVTGGSAVSASPTGYASDDYGAIVSVLKPAAAIAEYLFPEGSGLTSADSSGNNYTMTLGSGQWQTGYNGYGIQSNTTNSTPSVSNFGTGTLTTYTWMFWAKRSGTVSTWGQLLQDGVDFNVELWPSNEIEVNITDNGSNRITTGVIPLNTWTHVAFVRTGSTAVFYVNGVLTSNTGNIVTAQYDLVRTRTWRVGTGPDEAFPGVMDEVRLFDSALTSADITGWMNASSGPTMTALGWVI